VLSLPHRPTIPIEDRWAERKLFFWTAFMALKLILISTLVLCAVVSLIAGELPGVDLLLRSLSGG
jgi:hypothetical protein